jgi:hypothetical protein
MATNAIRVIVPYWHSGTWVFDDEDVGLHREPFVSGVPEILSEMVKDIPNAKAGFRLLFSESPFPGFQAQFSFIKSEFGGSWYKGSLQGQKAESAQGEVEGQVEGWLCSALFKYYSDAPQHLYVRAERLNH